MAWENRQVSEPKRLANSKIANLPLAQSSKSAILQLSTNQNGENQMNEAAEFIREMLQMGGFAIAFCFVVGFVTACSMPR